MLLSVRSGAAISMPGMMDTVLNLGLNDAVVEALASAATPRFAYDCYRRLLDMYADVVLGISHSLFDNELAAVRSARGVLRDVDLTAGMPLQPLALLYHDMRTTSWMNSNRIAFVRAAYVSSS